MAGGAPALPRGYTRLDLEETDGTNAEALRRVRWEAADRTVIVARSQTAGRGRQGRVWQSADGNLYASVLLRLDGSPPVGQLAFVAGLAVADAIAPFLPGDTAPRLKWPNDVLIDGAKAGGILIETEEGADGAQWAVVGIGINVASAPSIAGRAVASLRAAGSSADVEQVLCAVCQSFEIWLTRWRRDGFIPIRASWLAVAAGLGEPIEAHLPAGVATGVFEDIDESGALRLRRPDGTVSSVHAGEIVLAAA